YQTALYAFIDNQLTQWLQEPQAAIPRDVVYRFLHSIKGTAGTIGLPELSASAGDRMLTLERMDSGMSDWEPSALRGFLEPILAAANGTGPADIVNDLPADQALRAETDLRPVVLLIADDPAFQAYLQEGLEERGYMVIRAK